MATPSCCTLWHERVCGIWWVCFSTRILTSLPLPDDEFDVAVFGDKRYSLLGAGRKRWIENAKKQFPDNTDDVDRSVGWQVTGAGWAGVRCQLTARWTVLMVIWRNEIYAKMKHTLMRHNSHVTLTFRGCINQLIVWLKPIVVVKISSKNCRWLS